MTGGHDRSRPDPHRRVASGVRLAALALTFLLAFLAGLAGPAAAPAAATSHGLTVEITGITPAVATPDEPLTVRGTVRNDTGTALAGATVALQLQRTMPTTRRALELWLDPANAFRTILVAEEDLAETLPAGGEDSFTITVPPGGLGLTRTPSTWGPRGLELRAAGTAGPSTIEARTRTHLVWQPGSTGQPTSLAVVVPLAPTAAEFTAAADGDVAVADVSAPRVTALAQATAGWPQVAWALDPALLEADGSPDAEVEGTSPPPEGPPASTPSPPATSALAETLRAAAAGREIVALPYADADVAAQVHAGQLTLLADAQERGRVLREAAGITTVDGLAWPAGDTLDQETLDGLAEHGATAVLAPGPSLAPEPDLTYTPTARATVPTGDDATVAALVADEILAQALGAAATRQPEGTSDAARALAERQFLLASTAMITKERPSQQRFVLATLPRSFTGSPAALRERLAALADASWVALEPVTALLGTEPPAVGRRSLPDVATDDAEISAGTLSTIQRTRTELDDFAQIAEDPTALVRGQHARLLQVASAAWRTDPRARTAFAATTNHAAIQTTRAVGTEGSGTVNLISASGDLPVTVRNGLDQAVTVTVRLSSQDPALQVPDDVTVDVPAGNDVPVTVGVRAVGNADVSVLAELVNAQGRPVGTTSLLQVRVRADWEGVGTAIVAAVFGVALVIGLTRTIRRGHRRADDLEPAAAGATPTDAAPDAAPHGQDPP